MVCKTTPSYSNIYICYFFCTRKSTAVLNTKYYYNYSCNEPNINPTMLETWVYRWGLLSLQVRHCNNSDQKCSEPQLNSILQPHSVRLWFYYGMFICWL